MLGLTNNIAVDLKGEKLHYKIAIWSKWHIRLFEKELAGIWEKCISHDSVLQTRQTMTKLQWYLSKQCLLFKKCNIVIPNDFTSFLVVNQSDITMKIIRIEWSFNSL